MDNQKIAFVKKQLKRRQPAFLRQDAHKKAELHKNWREPRGHQSKMRCELRGKPAVVKVGYRSPEALRHHHSSGLIVRSVASMGDISSVDPKTTAVMIISSLGDRKRALLLKECSGKNIRVLNFKDFSAKLKRIDEKRMDQKKHAELVRARKSKSAPKPAKKGEALAEKLSGEEKKMEEKKERDKLLIQGQ